MARVYQLPCADGSLDFMPSGCVFQHLDDPDAALREMMSVTRVGGQVLDAPHADFRHAVFLDERLAAPVSASAISADEAEAFAAKLQARDQRGEFLGFAVGYSVLGTR